MQNTVRSPNHSKVYVCILFIPPANSVCRGVYCFHIFSSIHLSIHYLLVTEGAVMGVCVCVWGGGGGDGGGGRGGVGSTAY